MVDHKYAETFRNVGVTLLAVAILVAFGYSVAQATNDGGEGDQPTVTTLPTLPPDAAQVALIEDGVVTDAEMRSAYEAHAACVREHGYNAEVTQFYPRMGGELLISATREDGDRPTEVSMECRVRFVVEAEALYIDQRGLSAEERDRFNSRLAECLTSMTGAAVTAPDVLTQRHTSEYETCFEEMASALVQ